MQKILLGAKNADIIAEIGWVNKETCCFIPMKLRRGGVDRARLTQSVTALGNVGCGHMGRVGFQRFVPPSWRNRRW